MSFNNVDDDGSWLDKLFESDAWDGYDFSKGFSNSDDFLNVNCLVRGPQEQGRNNNQDPMVVNTHQPEGNNILAYQGRLSPYPDEDIFCDLCDETVGVCDEGCSFDGEFFDSRPDAGSMVVDDRQPGQEANNNQDPMAVNTEHQEDAHQPEGFNQGNNETIQFNELDLQLLLQQLKSCLPHLMDNPILREQCKNELIIQEFIAALQSDSSCPPVGVENSRSLQQVEETAPMNVEPQQPVNNNAPPPVYPSLPVEPQQEEDNNNNAAQVFGRQQDDALCLELVNRQHQQCIHLHFLDVVVADKHRTTYGTKKVWNKEQDGAQVGARAICKRERRQARRDLRVDKVKNIYMRELQSKRPGPYDERNIIFWIKIEGYDPPAAHYRGFVARRWRTDNTGWIYFIEADEEAINKNIRGLRGVV